MVAGRHILEAVRERAQSLAANAAQRLSAFAYSPPPVPGAGSPYAAQRLSRDEASQKLAESKEARYGRLTYGAGPSPARYSSHPATGLTPERVYNAFMQAETTGLCLTKADMTLQILRRDSHLRAVDHTVRTRVSGADWRIKPWDDSDLALAVARYVRAWWHDVDSLDRAMYGLLLAGADGYALHEMTDACKRVRFRGVNGDTVSVLGDHPRQLDFVHNKHVRFDPLTDAPMIDMGGGKFIDLPRGKVVFHTAIGDGLIETRGHIQSTAYLHCITHNAVTRWAIYLAQRGLPNVAYVVDRRAYEDLERRTHYENFVANIGNGLPTVMTNEGELKITPAGTEAGATGIHGALIGWGNNEKSKVVQGEQLTTEVGGNGAGYNTSETQAQTQDTWVRAIGRALAQDMRTGLVIPVLEKNAAALEAALGAPIDEIVRVAPLLIPHTQRPLNPATMVQVLATARNDLGLEVGAEEVRELLGLNPPREGDELPGRPVTVAKGAAVVPTDQAQDGPIKNLDEEAEGEAPPDAAMTAFSLDAAAGMSAFAQGASMEITAGVRAELRRGIEWYEQDLAGSGLESETVEEARRLLREGRWWPAKVSKARRFFGRNARYEAEMEGGNSPDPQRVSWALWGGAPARSQLDRIQLDEENDERSS